MDEYIWYSPVDVLTYSVFSIQLRASTTVPLNCEVCIHYTDGVSTQQIKSICYIADNTERELYQIVDLGYKF